MGEPRGNTTEQSSLIDPGTRLHVHGVAWGLVAGQGALIIGILVTPTDDR